MSYVCVAYTVADFELSDAQQEHALAVESLTPRLAALRIELCPGYMSEGSFWKVYFVLLHPRLEPQAAELLSTPEVSFLRNNDDFNMLSFSFFIYFL